MRSPNGNRGFTLLELVVAIMIMSLVVMIVAMALRLAMRYWERALGEEEAVQIAMVIPSLMDRQIGALVESSPFGTTEREVPLPWYGGAHGVSFFTAYAPMGSSSQGLLRVSYVFEPEEHTLSVYQQVIATEQDLAEEFNPLGDAWSEELEPVSRLGGIQAFDLGYAGQDRDEPLNRSRWEEEWGGKSGVPPPVLRLRLQVGESEGSPARTWYFRTGVQAL
jgi:prepilin-type N-terminal cleavage/methylation domain-containing protein